MELKLINLHPGSNDRAGVPASEQAGGVVCWPGAGALESGHHCAASRFGQVPCPSAPLMP